MSDNKGRVSISGNITEATFMKPDFDTALQTAFCSDLQSGYRRHSNHISRAATRFIQLFKMGTHSRHPRKRLTSMRSGLKTRTGFGKDQLFIKLSGKTWLWLLSNIIIAQKQMMLQPAPGLHMFFSCRKVNGESCTTKIQHFDYAAFARAAGIDM